MALPFSLITFGEHEVPSGLTAVLISPAALFVALFAPFIDPSERIDRRQGVGMVIGLLGVAIVVGVESISTLEQFLGALAMVGAAACYALGGFVVKRRYGRLTSIQASFVSISAASLWTLPAAVGTAPTETPGLGAVAAVVALGVVATALAFVIFYTLIAEVGAGRASLVSYLAPGRGAVLRRDLPRRGDHRRRHRRPGADPRRRRARLAPPARAATGAGSVPGPWT